MKPALTDLAAMAAAPVRSQPGRQDISNGPVDASRTQATATHSNSTDTPAKRAQPLAESHCTSGWALGVKVTPFFRERLASVAVPRSAVRRGEQDRRRRD